MSEEIIIIHNFSALKEKMETLNFYAEWTVYCEFGPEWIGSYRKMKFLLGEYEIGASPFFNELKEKFTTALKIPETSKDLVITGDADILLKQNQLIADYSWYAAVPYDEPEAADNDEIVFYP
ncbi:hypothetical protein [Kordia sp.]|uniref:hypothetical protein n=1 Tax=Kordia sp. TaxID=1965332 RepID=UPI003B5A1390